MSDIRGIDIIKLRERMRFDIHEFALLNGVHYTTAHRWEIAGKAHVKLDPLHRLILTHAFRRFPAGDMDAQLAQRIRDAVVIGGTLAGLAVLVEDLPKAAVEQVGEPS